MKTGIFYGSSTGTTAKIADRIAKALNIDANDIHDVAKTAPSQVGKYDLLILGSPTVAAGDLPGVWSDFLDGMDVMNLRGKRVAIYGLGDQTMKNTFCDAVGAIHQRVKDTGATMIGAFNTFPYEFDKSKAVPVEGAGAVGLLLDEVNHPEVTDRRIAEWIKSLAANS